jgi:hypothetical protein
MRNQMLRLIAFVCAISGGLAVAARAATPATTPSDLTGPAMVLEASAITVIGMAPNAEVAWLGVGLGTDRYSDRQILITKTLTADATGMCRLMLSEPVPRRTLWFAVEVATLRYAMTGGPGFVAVPMEEAGGRLNAIGGTGDVEIGSSRARLFGIAVRGGEGGGSWRVDGASAGPGLGAVPQAGASLRAGGLLPGKVKGSDLVILVDAQRLDYRVVGGGS